MISKLYVIFFCLIILLFIANALYASRLMSKSQSLGSNHKTILLSLNIFGGACAAVVFFMYLYKENKRNKNWKEVSSNQSVGSSNFISSNQLIGSSGITPSGFTRWGYFNSNGESWPMFANQDYGMVGERITFDKTTGNYFRIKDDGTLSAPGQLNKKGDFVYNNWNISRNY